MSDFLEKWRRNAAALPKDAYLHPISGNGPDDVTRHFISTMAARIALTPTDEAEEVLTRQAVLYVGKNNKPHNELGLLFCDSFLLLAPVSVSADQNHVAVLHYADIVEPTSYRSFLGLGPLTLQFVLKRDIPAAKMRSFSGHFNEFMLDDVASGARKDVAAFAMMLVMESRAQDRVHGKRSVPFHTGLVDC